MSTKKKKASEFRTQVAREVIGGAKKAADGALEGAMTMAEGAIKGAKTAAEGALGGAVSAAEGTVQAVRDTRIGATQESLDELMAGLNKAKEAARLAPPGDEYTKIAEYFAMPVMRGDAQMVLDLPEEDVEDIYKRVGKGFLESFAQSSAAKWDIGWLTDAAKAAMAGMVRGIFALDEENKNVVLEEQARVCFLDHLRHIEAWKQFGITTEPGSYTPDGAIAFLGNMLSLREVERCRDTIFWRGQTRKAYTDCCCVIFRAGIIDEQLPEYCECAVKLMRYQFEYLTGQPMDCAIYESLNCTGSDTCEFRVHIKPTVSFAKHYEHTRS